MTTTVNKQEIENFAADSSQWWDENGPFKPLHRLNPVRIGYIRDMITAHFDLAQTEKAPLKSLKVLDVGCGGGLVCEPLSRLGAKVTGLDADQNAIDVAQQHARDNGLKINYLNTATTELLETNRKSHNKYDVVTALEIIEHVDNPGLFIHDCFKLCRPGGLIIFSTLNRTKKSYALGIIAAEYILRWVPAGTHSWQKFVKPSEFSALIRENNGQPKDITGLIFNPLKNEFSLSHSDIDVNYLITAEKK